MTKMSQDQFALPEKAFGKVGIFGVRFIYPVIAHWNDTVG